MSAVAASALAGRRAGAADQAPVIVIGAGLAGLHAARMLQAEGVPVLVLEGSRRVGGRVITLDDVPGRPEAGLAVIGGMYGRTLDTCARLGLDLEIPVQLRKTKATRMLNIAGQHILHEDWAKSPRNPLPEADRAVLPDMIASTFLQRVSPLTALDDWIDPKFASWDRPTDAVLAEAGLNAEARRLVDVAAMTGGTSMTSALHDMRVYHWALHSAEKMFRDARHVIGGNQRLPEAMAASLKGPIHFGKAVVQIDIDQRGVDLRCADLSRYRARRVITTVPFSVLRNIDIHPAPPPEQSAAIEQLPYADGIQIYMVPERRYWERDGMPPGMWTDSPIDGVRALANDGSGEVTNIIIDLYGPQVRRFFFMSDAEIETYALGWLERLRPSTKGALRVMKIVNKSREMFARGDWPYWHPGQVGRFGRVARQPWQRLHFAGDGTAVMNRGAEAALESGERAAFEVLTEGV
jgi:monoamine oxidase